MKWSCVLMIRKAKKMTWEDGHKRRIRTSFSPSVLPPQRQGMASAEVKLCCVIVFQTGGGRMVEVEEGRRGGALLFEACCHRTRPHQTSGQLNQQHRGTSRRTRCGVGCSASPWWRDWTCRSTATVTFMSAFALVFRSTRA
ncbi:hypothetical protein INR49_007819, partial [Caranx melampygus]